MSTQNYSSTFTSAVSHLINIEGGYVDHASDPGGETKYGISKRQYPTLDIASLTVDSAAAIYYRDYYQAHQLDDLPPAFSCFLFDSLVNHRPKTAIKFVQSAVNVQADGILGPKSRGALNCLNANPEAIQRILARAFMFRADFYHDLMVEKPSLEAFSLGWFKRLFLLQQFILAELPAALSKKER